MSTYNKPYLTFEKQLELLKNRGLEVTDDKAALDYLRRVGYYHLSAYWYSFRKTTLTQDPVSNKISVLREDDFIDGCRFQHVVDLYVFDKRLRLLLLDAIERIEVAIRVDVAYLLGAKDSFAHTKPALLHGNFTKKVNEKTGKSRYQDWIAKHDELVKRSKEEFVRHYQAKYGLPLPIWVSVDLWDFGLLSAFYQGMSVSDKKTIATKYAIPDWQVMESWLRSLNYVRNVAAHHSRLWNKNLIDQPKMPRAGEIPAFDLLLVKQDISSRLYVIFYILIHFLKHICPNSSWPTRLKEMIESFPTVPNLGTADMGFPHDWRMHFFWQEMETVAPSMRSTGNIPQ